MAIGTQVIPARMTGPIGKVKNLVMILKETINASKTNKCVVCESRTGKNGNKNRRKVFLKLTVFEKFRQLGWYLKKLVVGTTSMFIND